MLQHRFLLKKIASDTQTLLTLSYAILIVVGAMFDYAWYGQFDINILQYSTILDFLVEPFRKPTILLFFSLSAGFIFLVYKVDAYWKVRWPNNYSRLNFGWDNKPWYPIYRNLMFGSLFIYYLGLASDLNARIEMRDWKGARVRRFCFNENQCIEGKLIGINSNYCFIKSGNSVRILPITSQLAYIEQ